jgi:dethiobiotin synthetase
VTASHTAIRGPVIVTGTDTGVGKTIVTAALAAAAGAAGLSVAVIKPGQTGIPAGSAEESDVDTIVRLAAPAVGLTLAVYPDPLAPLAAARVAGLAPLDLDTVLTAVRAQTAELVLIEGAGGLLVPMGPGWTIADLAESLAAPAVVVTRAGLGTLNHTALTLEALARRGIQTHVVIGAWPEKPELVHRTNSADVGPLAGIVPDGAGGLSPDAFRAAASGWLAPGLHGAWSDTEQSVEPIDEGPA